MWDKVSVMVPLSMGFDPADCEAVFFATDTNFYRTSKNCFCAIGTHPQLGKMRINSKTMISLYLPKHLLLAIQRQANGLGMPYSAYTKMVLTEKVASR